MKITVEFDSLQEIEDFCNGVVIAPGLAQACRKENAEAATEKPEEPKAKKSTPKKEKAQEEAKTETTVEPPHGVDNEDPIDAPAPAPAEKVDVVELRGLLAKVNRKTGTNTASQWIKDIAGKDKLTEVDDQEALAQIKAKAEEVLNA